MITAGSHPRKSTSDRARSISTITPHGDIASATRVPTTRSYLSIIADLACAVLFIAVGVSAAFPLVWGLALHQTPLAVSGGCAEAMCLFALINRVFAPAAAKERWVPFLAALELRPWLLAVCLALMVISAVTLITYWPGMSG